MDVSQKSGSTVPDDVIPRGDLPPLSYREMPPPVPLSKMIGPSIILAGLALGSGEFILWPKITFHFGYLFFWACILGVTIQYFINMEVTRWTLATGESAITGFCRLSKRWAWVFLAFNILPWIIPGWAMSGSELLSWLVWPETAGQSPREYSFFFWESSGGGSPFVVHIATASLLLCGAILTAGPVVYDTVEKLQTFLVAVILILLVVLAFRIVDGEAVAAMFRGLSLDAGLPKIDPTTGITVAALLGALAFAGAGGTLNLGQSNYVKDKGYGMGRYIGRITSPVTGQSEAMSEIGCHFPATQENLSRWRVWWRRASVEHFLTFYLTCLVCLVLLTLITYSIFYEGGQRAAAADKFDSNLAFIWGQAAALGGAYQTLFLIMGVAILLTTELGILDVTSRVSADIVKVNWLRDNEYWTESRLYSAFLWSTITLGIVLLFVTGGRFAGLKQVVVSSALNGGVMFCYCITLIVLNRRGLPKSIRMSTSRFVIMLAATAFFGFFVAWFMWSKLSPWLTGGRA